LPSQVFTQRRANQLYLDLIGAITFYHQHQRKTTNEKGRTAIETTAEDIEWANKLAAPVLLRKSDELSGACRSFLEELKAYLNENKQQEFTRKEIRAAFRLHPSKCKRYMAELSAFGYVERMAGNNKQGFSYALSGADPYDQLKEQAQLATSTEALA
jgi:DNA primase